MKTLRSNIKYHVLLFFISPLLGFIYGLKTKSNKYIRWTLFAFVAIYGSLFHVSYLGDGAGHWDRVYEHYINLSFHDFWERLIDILALTPQSTTNTDVYTHVLSYVMGSVLSIPQYFFAGVAIVFAYFYSGAMMRLANYINWKSNYNKVFFAFFFVVFLLWQAPHTMQSVRTSTALWVLIYAVLSYHDTKKKKYLLLVFAPVLFHIGYVLLCVPVWLVLFSGFRRPSVYFIIFIASMFYSNIINPTSFKDIASQNKVGATKFEAYNMNEQRTKNRGEKLEAVADRARFYKTYAEYRVQNFVLSGLVIFFYLLTRKRRMSNIQKALFSYGLAVASFANFFTFLYAVHNRSWVVAGVFILSFFIIFLSTQNLKRVSFSFLKIKIPLFLFTIALLPFVMYQLSSILNYTSPYVFFMPIVNWIESDMGTNLKEVIVLIL